MDERKIVHVDLDAFFARVEKLDRPELMGEPVVVGGQSERGVVSTACYRAREHGVHSAMPMGRAKKLCPEATFLPVRGDRYREISEEFHTILESFTPEIEKLSLDEAFLDVTGVLHHFDSCRDLAEQLKQETKDRLRLTCSVGIGANKMIAKLASEHCKPDGLLEIVESEKQDFLRKLPVEAIWGVGEKTAKKLEEFGVQTIKDLQETELSALQDEFGTRAVILKRRARGEDPSPVKSSEEVKSISNEETFSRDLREPEKMKKLLFQLTEKVARRLREENLEARTVELKLRRGDFTTLTRSYSGQHHTNITEKFWQIISTLFEEEIELDQRGVRLLGVGVSNLQPVDNQSELFEDDAEANQEKLNSLIDNLNEEYGSETIVRGKSIINESTSSEN